VNHRAGEIVSALPVEGAAKTNAVGNTCRQRLRTTAFQKTRSGRGKSRASDSRKDRFAHDRRRDRGQLRGASRDVSSEPERVARIAAPARRDGGQMVE